MNFLQKWVNNLLVNLGITNDSPTLLDNVIILAIILLIAFGVNYVCKHFLLKLVKKITKQTKNNWDNLIVERKIVDRVVSVIPAFIIYLLLPLAFSDGHETLNDLLTRLCVVYIIAVLLRVINASLNVVYEIFEKKSIQKNTPFKGLIQVIQIIVIFIGIIFIIATIVNKSPVHLFAGLGASAAILSLVFKDSLVGLISGIQLSANDMLRPGDWITVPKHGVDGDVIEVGLTTVKVKNFDNTISTIPPSALITDSFQNWRGMAESGGRRIKRSIYIDMNSIGFCTPEMLERFKKISLLTNYIVKKEAELEQYNKEHHIDESVQVNGRRQTNLGVFRAYIEQYLKHHPKVNQNLTCMVRHLQPTEKGIPLELYFFSAEKRWVPYESIMADVFDHILASVSEFDLHVFQNISGYDLQVSNRN